MRKVIDGHRYDTDTARLVGSWESGEDAGDLHYVAETLYRTKAGLYFVHGEGGAMTSYAEACGANSWSSGERIMPMSIEDARSWAERRLSADEYEAEWGEVEDAPATTVRLDGTTYRDIRDEAARSGRTLGEVIADAIRASR